MAMHPALNIAVKAAREAARIINRASLETNTLKIDSKASNDFVTEVDKGAEAAIIRVLQEAYPDHGILAEESGDALARPDAEYLWIIDPLDGTTNFIHGVPQYAISIALSRNGVLEQGVVYDPIKNELFTATRGRGAFLNDRRIRVSGRARMNEALIGTGFPFRAGDNIDAYLTAFKELCFKTAGIRRAGSAALDLAYVACGRYDAFWELQLRPWDIAAGALLVLESGGLITDAAGEANFLQEGSVVAGTPKIFTQILPVIQNSLV